MQLTLKTMWKFKGQQRPSFAITPREGEESVWDYPRPPMLVADKRRITVHCGELLIADSSNCTRVLETASPPTVYIPKHDVKLSFLEQATGSSFCEWKGAATYWSLATLPKQIKNVGWSYESPSKAFQSIAGYLSFYPALIECRVDGERVRPQAGGFYGGWVTNEIIGPYKGEPGTTGW